MKMTFWRMITVDPLTFMFTLNGVHCRFNTPLARLLVINGPVASDVEGMADVADMDFEDFKKSAGCVADSIQMALGSQNATNKKMYVAMEILRYMQQHPDILKRCL